MATTRTKVNRLYNGTTRRSARFRFLLLAFDLVTITYFIIASMVTTAPWLVYIDVLIGLVLMADFAARLWIDDKRLEFFLSATNLVDLVVIVTLLLPIIAQNFAFLRVVRALRLVRSYRVLMDLRKYFKYFAANEDIIQSVLNLFVFIFFVTALVYVMQVGTNEDINNYVDALYFTVTTLTTTGFGDITLHGTSGHLLSVVIMVVGVGLFLRLIQTIFHPTKVRYKCPKCGLNRHDPDAVHCKHCGDILNIETEGI